MKARKSDAASSLGPRSDTRFSLPPDGSRASRGHKLLLYVEDNDDNWEVAEYRLGKDYELVRARNAEQACKIVRERHEEIDGILMDIELSGSDLNGVELTELLRGNGARLPFSIPSYAAKLPYFSRPVIYLTAHGKLYTRVQLMLSGAEKVVEKPISFTVLRELLEQVLPDRVPGTSLRASSRADSLPPAERPRRPDDER